MALSGDERLRVVIDAKETASQEIARLSRKLEELGGKDMVRAQRTVSKLNREINMLEGGAKKARPIWTRFTQGIAIGNIAADAAQAALRGIVNAMKDTIGAALATERAYAQAVGALKRQGVATDENIAKLRQFSDEMQTMTGVADEEFALAVQRLMDHGADLTHAMQLVASSQDVATARGKTLTTILDQVSDALMRNNYDALKKWGVEIERGTDRVLAMESAVEQLNESFGGAAADAADTYAVRLNVLQQKFGDLQEKIGGAVIPVFEGLTNILIEVIDLIFAFTGGSEDAAGGAESLGYVLNSLADDIRRNREGIVLALDALVSWGEMMLLVIKNVTAPWLHFFAGMEAGWEALGLAMSGDFTGALNRLGEGFNLIRDSVIEDVTAITVGWQDALTQSGWAILHFEGIALSSAERQKKAIEDLGELRIPPPLADDSLEALDDFSGRMEQVKKTMKGLAKEGAIAADKIGGDMVVAGTIISTAIGSATSYAAEQFGFLQKEAANIWEAMAQDFSRLFIDEILRAVEKTLIPKILGFIGSLFDTTANDLMAKKQGMDFGNYFGSGVMAAIQHISDRIGEAAASIPAISTPYMVRPGAFNQLALSPATQRYLSGYGQAAPTTIINFNAPVSDRAFIQNNVLPLIEQGSKDALSYVALQNEQQTGARDVRI